jgi:hypothetical protein
MEKELYYYIRGENNSPEVTVCLIIGEKGYYRGVAICSLQDQPIKAYGRELAQMRAYRAFNRYELQGKNWRHELINYKSKRPLSFEAMEALFRAKITEKSSMCSFNELSKYEQKLVIANSNMVKIDCEFIPAKDTHVPVQMMGV